MNILKLDNLGIPSSSLVMVPFIHEWSGDNKIKIDVTLQQVPLIETLPFSLLRDSFLCITPEWNEGVNLQNPLTFCATLCRKRPIFHLV